MLYGYIQCLNGYFFHNFIIRQHEEMQAALEPGVNGANTDNYHESVNNLAARHCEDTQVHVPLIKQGYIFETVASVGQWW